MYSYSARIPLLPVPQVRPVGVTKGLAMQRLVGLIAVEGGLEAAAFDYVLCIGGSVDRYEAGAMGQRNGLVGSGCGRAGSTMGYPSRAPFLEPLPPPEVAPKPDPVLPRRVHGATCGNDIATFPGKLLLHHISLTPS